MYLYEGEADFSNVKMFTGSNKAVDANDDKILSQSRSNKDWRGTPFFKLCTVPVRYYKLASDQPTLKVNFI